MDPQALDVTNKLTGRPTADELKALYIKFDFDRKRLAKHLNMSESTLLRFKNKMLGDCVLPSTSSYMRQFNEVQWYTTKFAEWTHIPKRQCKGNASDIIDT